MKRISLFSTSLLAAIVASGCAAAPVGDDDDDGGGGGGGGGDGPVPTSIEGRFAVTSEFDLATNAPGTAGKIANYFIQATDDPDDPVHFVVDQLIAALPDGTIKNLVKNAAPFVTGYLNDRLLEVAPDFVTTIVDVGDAFGQVTRNFGTLETLDIKSGGVATRTVHGLHFKIDTVDMNYEFADYNIPETKVDGLHVDLSETGKITVSDHKVPLKYGQVLRIALDQAVIPWVDPSATNLEDVLTNHVNCIAVGQYVYDAIGFGSPSTFESACTTGLKLAAQAAYKAISDIDSAALEFALTGTARGVDRSGDGKMDEINAGKWAGTLGYAGNPAPLGENKFSGKQM